MRFYRGLEVDHRHRLFDRDTLDRPLLAVGESSVISLDALSSSLLVHLMKGGGGVQQNGSLADGCPLLHLDPLLAGDHRTVELRPERVTCRAPPPQCC